MADKIDWLLERSSIKKHLMTLSKKKLKLLCKSNKVKYSEDKMQTITNLLDASATIHNNNTTKKAAHNTDQNATNDLSMQTCSDNKHIRIKIGILGESNVGRKSLMIRYTEDKATFENDYFHSIFMEKEIKVKNEDIKMSLWIDQSDRSSPLLSLVLTDAKCVLFVFDLLSKYSLYSIKALYKASRKENKTFIPVLVGNKYDLFMNATNEYKLDISKHARKFASKMHSPLVYCSAKTGENVKIIFKWIISKVFGYKNKIKEKIDELEDAIIEFQYMMDIYSDDEMICIVNGYIRMVQKKYKWHNVLPVMDLANMILLFYGNIIIGNHNKEYKKESRKHKKDMKIKQEKKKKQAT
eukprot:41559_1